LIYSENKIKLLEIFGIKLANVTYEILLSQIKNAIKKDSKLLVTYATAHTLNRIYYQKEKQRVFRQFDLIHPDGIGAFIALRFIYGRKHINKRITGSDFYSKLINEAKIKRWKIFFWGDRDEILTKIKYKHNSLLISGFSNGFDFNTNILIENINRSNTDILIVGLGSILQEQWIVKLHDDLKVKVILAVGDGIKVIAGSRYRGPKVIRKMGMEWIIRLFTEPKRLWKRYLIGMPLFLYRIIKLKILLNKNYLR